MYVSPLQVLESSYVNNVAAPPLILTDATSPLEGCTYFAAHALSIKIGTQLIANFINIFRLPNFICAVTAAILGAP